jgi:uncharacterized HhH-GPD family protein
VHLATTDAANELLASDPLALLIGMLLDQQITMEKAFTSPAVLAERLGVERLDARMLADYDPDALEAVFRKPPALHRFPAAMAKRVQALARAVSDQYRDDPARIWNEAEDGPALVRRLAALPGFGDQKAKIFTALLGKQLGVQPAGWREAAGSYGEAGSFRSVADVVDAASLSKVREFKQDLKRRAKGQG